MAASRQRKNNRYPANGFLISFARCALSPYFAAVAIAPFTKITSFYSIKQNTWSI